MQKTHRGLMVSTLGLWFILTGCAHKIIAPAAGVGSAGPTDANAQISEKPIDSDASGSDSGKIAGLETVHFDFDQAALTKEAKAIIQGNTKWMKGHDDQNMQIEGYCDHNGSTEYNLALGERRANRVKQYMVDLGISVDRITTISYGSEKPLDASDSPEADAKNRRANFVPMPAIGKRASR